MKEYKRYMITCALPYANGPIHIGHLAGVYVPADIYVRYLRLKGRDVVWVCGSDEHGVPITIRAKQEGCTPQEVVDKYNALIKQSFADFGISFDIYHRTSSALHHETASAFFKDLLEAGKFELKETEQYYDTQAQQFLADRYIVGTCPHCGNPEAYGDQCEKCGTSLNATDLIDPHSTLSGSKPVMKKTTHWFLPLNQYQQFLEHWILEEHKEWKPNVYGQCKSWLDLGLQPRAVSRDLPWGVPVPIEGVEGKVLYVWFDAPIGYISATKALRPDWEKYWKDPDTRLIHFIGKDNIVFHCIVFPAMLHAHGDYILPDNVPANEFLNLEGRKLSTSKNWAVWLHEYLADFPGKQDVLRYALTANMPETKDNDFTWSDFQSRNNNELVAVLGNFVNRALVLCHKYTHGQVPPAHDLQPTDRAVLEAIPAQREKIEQALEDFHFRDALKEFMQLARIGNKYLAEQEPWKLVKQDAAAAERVLYVSLQITAALAVLGEPFLPFTMAKLKPMLRLPAIGWDALTTTPLPVGHSVGEPALLFEKIEDAAIEAQLAKLEAHAPKPSCPFPAFKPEVSIEDFDKLDLRVGKILKAEKMPKADKLLRFEVDLGHEVRTIVSGVAKQYTPEALVGKQVTVIANLAARKLRGVESHGMLLFAEDAQGQLRYLQPSEEVEPGTTIS